VLREVGDFVLAPTAKLVDDLLTVDVHLTLLSDVVAVLPACPLLAVGGSAALLRVVLVVLDTSESPRPGLHHLLHIRVLPGRAHLAHDCRGLFTATQRRWSDTWRGGEAFRELAGAIIMTGIEVYGPVSERVLGQLREKAADLGEDGAVAVHAMAGGFSALPAQSST